jgi:hypothetical protein
MKVSPIEKTRVRGCGFGRTVKCRERWLIIISYERQTEKGWLTACARLTRANHDGGSFQRKIIMWGRGATVPDLTPHHAKAVYVGERWGKFLFLFSSSQRSFISTDGPKPEMGSGSRKIGDKVEWARCKKNVRASKEGREGLTGRRNTFLPAGIAKGAALTGMS